jgi:hypothetical protein
MANHHRQNTSFGSDHKDVGDQSFPEGFRIKSLSLYSLVYGVAKIYRIMLTYRYISSAFSKILRLVLKAKATILELIVKEQKRKRSSFFSAVNMILGRSNNRVVRRHYSTEQ